MEERKKKTEAVSYELIKMCVEKGLTITEMFEVALMFPRLVKEEISKMEQRVSFTVESDSGYQG